MSRDATALAAPPTEPRAQETGLLDPHAFTLVMEMAHDFRSPLSCILMLTESLLHGRVGPLTDLQQRHLRLVYGAALGLCATTNDVMELAQHDGHVTDETAEPFSITAILRAVQDQTELVARERGLAFQVEVSADHARIGRSRALTAVLLNLMIRAIQATDSGAVTLAARAIEGDNDRVHFSVSDTSSGIQDEGMAMLFQPFASGTAEKPYDFSASGLGRLVCRRLLREMGATLEVTPVTPQGTQFSFVLDLPVAVGTP